MEMKCQRNFAKKKKKEKKKGQSIVKSVAMYKA